MSLVNEMLNKLQKSQIPSAKFESYSLPVKKRYSLHLFGWLFFLISLAIIYYLLIEKKEHDALPLSKTISHSNQQKLIAAAKPKLSSNKIISNAVTTSDVSAERIEQIAVKQKPSQTPSKKIVKSVAKKNALVIATNRNKTTTTVAVGFKADSNTDRKTPQNKKIKIVSKKNNAHKAFLAIQNTWGQYTVSENKKRIEILLSQYPLFPSLWYNVLSLVGDNDPIYYFSILNDASNRFPKNSSFQFLSAKYYFDAKKYQKSAFMLRLIDNKDWKKSTYQLAGLVHQKLKNDRQAIYFYKKFLSYDPGRGDINMAIAISYEALDQNKNATFYFLLALKDPRLTDLQRQFVKQRVMDNS